VLNHPSNIDSVAGTQRRLRASAARTQISLLLQAGCFAGATML